MPIFPRDWIGGETWEAIFCMTLCMWLCLGLESEDVLEEAGGETCNDNPFDISVVGGWGNLQLT